MLAGDPVGSYGQVSETSSIWTCSWSCHHLAPWLWERAIEFDCVGTEKVITLGVLAVSKGMVSGYLGSLTTEERTLLHLVEEPLPKNKWEAQDAVTQAGISAAVYVQRKTCPSNPEKA